MALSKSIQAVWEGSPVSSTYQPIASDATTLLTEITDGHLPQFAVGVGAVGAPSYAFFGRLTDGMWSPGSGIMAWSIGGAEAMRLTGAQLLMGSSNSISGQASPKVSVQGTTNATTRVAVMRASADTSEASIALAKTRGAAVDTYTIVQAGDFVGTIGFYGADGVDAGTRGAAISAYVIGTPGVGDVRAGLKLRTGSGANTLADRLTIDATIAAFSLPVVLPSYTVAGLPSAATVGAGAMAYVTDSNTTTFNATVASGGANKIKVTSDGTNWKVG